MDLLNNNATDDATKTRDRITNRTKQAFQNLIREYRQLWREVWNHPRLTPQQVFDSLGTDAGEWLQHAYATYAYINDRAPDALDLPAPSPMTINDDGTVTVLVETVQENAPESESTGSETETD